MPSAPLPPDATQATLKVGPDGRILIPAGLRRRAGIEPGKTMTVRIEGDHLVLEDPVVAIRRLQESLASLRRPGESIVDELIADRRAEAARE
jgi:AbrB family looped-hinge helix DNA binding protein